MSSWAIHTTHKMSIAIKSAAFATKEASIPDAPKTPGEIDHTPSCAHRETVKRDKTTTRDRQENIHHPKTAHNIQHSKITGYQCHLV